MTGPERVPLAPGWSLWPVVALRGAGVPFELLDGCVATDLLGLPVGEDRNARLRGRATEATAAAVLDDGLREALVWQNPEVVDTWLGDYATRLAGDGPARLSNRAYREGLIARYLQRYCTKNESIGFFGPVAWATWALPGHGLEQSGAGGLRRRTVYLETWAVAALADAWRHDERLLPHLPVRLDPVHALVDGMVHRPRRLPAPVEDPLTAAVLAAVDGNRPCGEVIAAATTGTPRERREELLRLHDRGVLQIGFRVPHHERPEEHLLALVGRVADAGVRAELRQRVDDVVAARDALQARLTGGPEPVRAALRELTDRFEKSGLSDAAASRRTDYARTVAYLDCRRDTDVRLGADLLARLRAPLTLLLDAAAWLTGEVAAAVAEGLLERYRQMRAHREPVTLVDLLFASGDLLSPHGPVATAVLEDFQLRWAELLPAPGPGETTVAVADVAPMARALFPAPAGPRWAAAGRHSPDLMLTRAADGDWRWVLGELHVALNTLESRVFRTQSDDPEALVALTRGDLGTARVVPLYPIGAPEATSRTYPPAALDPPGAYHYWSYARDSGHADGVTSVSGTEIVVGEEAGELVGRPRGQDWSAPVAEFFGDFLTAVVVNLFRVRPARPHQGRVVLDDLVVCRESWCVPVDELPVPPPGRRIADRGYQEVRDWASALGVARHVFVTAPGERKPFYVDFESPLLVGNFVRSVRRQVATAAPGAAPAVVTLVEMLPAPGELWLKDAAGRHYTAEFRMTAVQDQERPA